MRKILIAASVALALAATACSEADTALETPGPTSVILDGVEFSYECRGQGGPVAFIETGLGGPNKTQLSRSWYGWDEAFTGMAELTTVCIYGRRGLSGSTPLPDESPRTSRDQVEDLQLLWKLLDAPLPVVLVGHSIAGYNLRLVADEAPGDIAGLVFVDATTPGFLEFESNFPDPFAPEWLDVVESSSQVADVGDVGATPTYVLTAGATAEQWWLDLQSDLAEISTNSQQVVDPESSHHVYRDNPQAVVDGLAWVLTQID